MAIYLFVADGIGGVATYDISDRAQPARLGGVALEGAATSITTGPRGAYVYVAAGQGGVSVVDVRVPSDPMVVATLDGPGTALQVAVGAGHAFVTMWNDVRVWDIADPAKPRLVATERIDVGDGFPRVLGIAANGRHAYLGEWTGLYAYELRADLSAPDLWIETQRLDLGSVDAQAASSAAILVRNDGTEVLTVQDVTAANDAFVAAPQTFSLEPGGSEIVEITYTAATVAPAGELGGVSLKRPR